MPGAMDLTSVLLRIHFPDREIQTRVKGYDMEWNKVTEHLPFVYKEVRRKWGRFTKEDLVIVAGCRESFIRVFELRYGDDHAATEVKIDTFIEGLHLQPEVQKMLAWPSHLWFGVKRHLPFQSPN